jgi:serine/threonine protein phosphatase PrpC
VSGLSTDTSMFDRVRVGVVRTVSRRQARGGFVSQQDNYLVCDAGRIAWCEGDEERIQRVPGNGTLLAVVDGESDAEGGGGAVANAVARVLSKLYGETVPDDPLGALSRFLVEAHTRMYWRARQGGAGRVGASVAMCWLHQEELSWVCIGSARVYLCRGGVIQRLGRTWSAGCEQRIVRGSRGLGDDTSVHLRDGANRGRLRMEAGDRLVLLTDGLWERIDDASLGQVFRHVADAQAAAVAVVERALARGAEDHLTVVVADVVMRAVELRSVAVLEQSRVLSTSLRRAAPVEDAEPQTAAVPERSQTGSARGRRRLLDRGGRRLGSTSHSTVP